MLVVLENNLSKAFRDYFCALSGIEIIPASVGVFNAGRPSATQEPFSELWFGSPREEYEAHIAKLKDQPVTVIQSMAGNTGQHTEEIFATTDTLRECGAGIITAALDYAAYARQDRKFPGRICSVMGKTFPKLLKAAGVDRVILNDLHSRTAEDYYKKYLGENNVALLSSAALFADDLKARPDIVPANTVFAAPDGWDKPDDAGQRRVRSAAAAFYGAGADVSSHLAGLVKTRTVTGAGSSITNVRFAFGAVAGKKAILVDDIGDTCGTVLQAGGELLANGAASIEAYLTHWTGDAGSLEKVLRARTDQGAFIIDRLTLTDSAPYFEDDVETLEKQYPGITSRVGIVRTAPMFAQKILSW